MIGEMLPGIGGNDLLIITADHGCDPTYKGTDHTREYVPVLVYGAGLAERNLGVRNTFADIAQTVVQCFEAPEMPEGTGFFAR